MLRPATRYETRSEPRSFRGVPFARTALLALLLPQLLPTGTTAAQEPTGPAPPPTVGPFPERAAERGLVHGMRSGTPEKLNILESHGSGVALLDLGADGDLDVVAGDGCESLAALLAGPGSDLAVFENDGRAHFTRRAGPGLGGWWSALAAGDVDGDGRTDLLAGAYGDLALLLQAEDGSLARLERESRRGGDRTGLLPDERTWPGARLVPGAAREPGRAPLWVTALALLDADRDGYLDLYVGQHLDLDPLAPPGTELGEGPLARPCTWKGHQVYCGPRGLVPQPDRLLRGLGNGSFVDRTDDWLPGHEAAFTLAVGVFDAGLDGDADLYVANDSMPNRLLLNAGDGEFDDYAERTGVAVGSEGRAEAGMGVAVADVDLDGLWDLALTNFSDEPTQLYLGSPRGFRNATWSSGLGHQSRPLLSWGVHLADFDGDGRVELFTSNGHVYPAADEPGTGTSYGQPDTLWRLDATGSGLRALRVDGGAGPDLLVGERPSRGTALGDLDGDGRPDLVVAQLDGPLRLGLNRMGSDASRLAIRCLGAEREQDAPDLSQLLLESARDRRTPRDGSGALVLLHSTSGEPQQMRETTTTGSYLSSQSPWLHFGLGDAEAHEGFDVLWPSGRVEVFEAGPVGRRLVIVEGRGIVSDEPLRATSETDLESLAGTSQPTAPALPEGSGELDATTLVGDAVSAYGAALAAFETDRLSEVEPLLGDAVGPDGEPAAWLLAARANARAGHFGRSEVLAQRWIATGRRGRDAALAWSVVAEAAREREDAQAWRDARTAAEREQLLGDSILVRQRQIAAHPDSPEPRLGLARAWLEAGEAERGVELLAELTARFPDFAEGWSTLGDARRLVADLHGAAAAYERALALEPERKRERYVLALLELARGRYAEAAVQGERVLSELEDLDPLAPAVWLLVARAKLLGGDRPAADEAYATYRGLGGQDPLEPR